MLPNSSVSFHLSHQAKRFRSLLLAFAILICTSVIAGAYFYIQNLESALRKERAIQLDQLSGLLLQHTEQIYREATGIVDHLHYELMLRKIENEGAYQQYASSLSTHQYMKHLASKSPLVDGMLYAANDGQILNTVRYFPPTKKDNVSEREPFRYFSQHNDVATLYTVPTLIPQDGKWRLGVSRRVNGRDGIFLGVITGGILIEGLVAYYRESALKLGDGAAIALYRKNDQIVLAHYPENEAILGKASPALFISQSLAAKAPIDKVIESNEPGLAPNFNLSSERVRLFQESKEFPLILGISVPLSFGMEQQIERQKWVYTAAGITCLITIFLAVLLYRSVYEAQKYQFMAGIDELTHIPNKSFAHQLLKQSLAAARRNQTKLALLYIDLNRFKEINDTAGHDIGDLILEEVAKRIKSCARDSDSVCRDGGDEFVMILPEIHDTKMALVIAQKVHDAVILPIEIGERTYSVGASIGLALYPEHGHSEIELLRNADNAMYAAKRANLTGIRVFGA